MAGTQVQLRRGTTAEHSTFTGAEGEVTVDTTKDTLVVHDGTTAGGVPLAKASDLGALAAQGDGDKGDITVSSSGGTWTIDNNAVTYAKMQDVTATSRVIGRKTAGSGDPEEVTLSELLDFIGSAAQGDILYRGSSAWARLGAGTSGQFLKTQGAGANPAWDSVSAGGMTLLGTLTTTSGTTQSLSSLNLTDYKLIIFTTDGVSCSNSSRALRIGSATVSINASAESDGLRIFGFLDLSLGIAVGVGTYGSAGASVGAGASGYSTATTEIQFSWSSTGNFDAGSIKVYGVK